MKKTQIKYLLRAIWKNKASFFSVAMIAAVSMAVFLGMQAATDAMYTGADEYFRQNRLQTAEISCANGITDEDISAMGTRAGVDAVEGGYTAAVLAESEHEQLIIQARSICENMNTPVVLEGVLPAAPDEVAVEQIYADNIGISPGDTLVIDHEGALLSNEFTVTAIVNDPAYACSSLPDTRGRSNIGIGSVSYYIMLDKSAFDDAYFNGCYTTAFIYSRELAGIDYFSDEYEEKEARSLADLRALGEERAKLRYDAIVTEATDKLAAVGMEADLTELGIEHRDWIVSGRQDIGDIRGINNIIGMLYALSYSLASLFLVVAVIVCYAAITRMISEQRGLVGAQKALGMTGREILTHYIMYNVLCALAGILISGIITFAAEYCVIWFFKRQFLFGGFRLTLIWQQYAVVAAVFLVIFILSSYLACVKLSREPAISLLRGELPTKQKRSFYETWGIYKRLSLYSRTMIKNVLTDKARMMTTIMGVVGCISLLLICFSLRLSVENAPKVQFENYYLFNDRLAIDGRVTSGEEYEEILDAEGIAYERVHEKITSFRVNGGSWESVHIIAASQQDGLAGYITLEDIETKDILSVPTDGILISRKCAEAFKLSRGSVVEVMDHEGRAKEVEVSGVIEHYLPFHLFVTHKDYYREAIGEETLDGLFLLKGSVDGLLEKVRGEDGFLFLRDNSEYEADVSAYDMVIGVCLGLAAVMAFLVLLNQVVMHINKKAVELSVMRINGYTLKETKAYIYKDNIVLTVLGLLLGCVIGVIVAYLEILVTETGANRYVRTPSLEAILLACLVGAFFSWIVNMIALRKVNKLNLTNVNGN